MYGRHIHLLHIYLFTTPDGFALISACSDIPSSEWILVIVLKNGCSSDNDDSCLIVNKGLCTVEEMNFSLPEGFCKILKVR